ncbi:MAG: DegV family protein [Lachnospiraceae bacterium]|nr:DegV family protein [Lachnospiraceae bacterium]
MKTPVIITCDSGCDLLPDLKKQYDVPVAHMYIRIGDDEYVDGVSITPDEIYQIYEEKGILPKTSAIPVPEYLDFFRHWTERGYAVIHIALSSEISCTCQNAVLAASELENVTVLDSLSLSCGGGLLVEKAYRLREEGLGAEEIAEEIRRTIALSRTQFIVSDLTFLAKGGRCSTVAALGANILRIKPEVIMNNGSLSVGRKFRGSEYHCYEHFIRQSLLEVSGTYAGGTAVVYHAGIDEALFAPLVDMAESTGLFEKVYTARAGSLISSHCGRHTVGFSYQPK